MTAHWDAANARVRGLGTHLVRPERVPELAAAADLSDLLRRLEHVGCRLTLVPGPLTAATIDRAIRRLAASKLRLLARWCADRAAALTVIFEVEDYRSLRILIRGAAAGRAPHARRAGTLPTTSQPRRAREELARQTSLQALHALLAAWGNPYSVVLKEVESPEHPDLLRVEVRLGRLFAQRALEAAHAEHALSAYVRETVDLENVWTAVLLAGDGGDVAPSDCFITGGERITRAIFEHAAAAPDRPEACGRLARAFGSLRLAELDDIMLAARLTEYRAVARLDPLSSVPLLAFALALRSEARMLSRLVWGVALGIPASALAIEAAPPS